MRVKCPYCYKEISVLLERATFRKKRQGRPLGLPDFEWPPRRSRVLRAVKRLAEKWQRDSELEGSSIREISRALHSPTAAETRSVLEALVLAGIGDIRPSRGNRWVYVVTATVLEHELAKALAAETVADA